jgi:transposase
MLKRLRSGRKNWIHIGSAEAGHRVAAILSIVETCRWLKIPVRRHLDSVVPGLANFPYESIRRTHPRRQGGTKPIEQTIKSFDVIECWSDEHI